MSSIAEHTPHSTARLRRLLERPTKVYLWGQPRWVYPRVINEVFGDGRQLISVGPISHRPNYYVVRIDSAWELSNHAKDAELLCDHLDEIYEAIIDQFGEGGEDNGEAPFPALDLDIGTEWGALDWPTREHQKHFCWRSA